MTQNGSDKQPLSSTQKISSVDNSSLEGASSVNPTSPESLFPADPSPESMSPTDPSPCVLKRSVFFIGFMGAGKTTIARHLARMCGVSAIDVDMYIERQQDQKISEIFSAKGEEGFRKIETETLRELAQREPALISCGGGVILKPENRKIIKDAGFVIYLEVPVEEAACRISDTSSRPLFKDIEQAKKICSDRIPLYEETADAIVDTSGKRVGLIAPEIKKILRNEGIW